jgi:hypothetical protein
LKGQPEKYEEKKYNPPPWDIFHNNPDSFTDNNYQGRLEAEG